jgi:site-specific DNA-methyltransferase (adenine-specific)
MDAAECKSFLESLPDKHAHCVVMRNNLYLPEAFRILRHGGVCLAFSTTRTLSATFRSLEDAGFIIRDVIAWVNPSIPSSSFGMSHLITRSQDLTELEKEEAMKDMAGLRTMRLRTCYTPIVLAQRPTCNTLVNNQIENECGLMNPTRVASGALSSNCMTTDFSDSLYDQAFLLRSAPFSRVIDTQPDPLYRIMHHLLETFTHAGNIVVDPQAGDGAVMCAAISLGREYEGSEDNSVKRAGAMERAARCKAALLSINAPEYFRMIL